MTGGGGSGSGSGGGGGIKPPTPNEPPTSTPSPIPAGQEIEHFTTVQEIASHMANKWGLNVASLMNPEFKTVSKGGSPTKDLSVESMRQFAQAVDDMMTKYPFLRLEGLQAKYGTGNKPAGSYAFATPSWVSNPSAPGMPGFPAGYDLTGARWVTLNAPMASDGDRALMRIAYKNGERDSRTRDFNEDAMNRPVYYTMIHEMGHIMDYNGAGVARQKVTDAIDAKFSAESGRAVGSPGYKRALNEWLSTRLVSAYSFKGSDRSKGIYEPEAIAEAFLDVEARGTRADELSKLIHDIVVEEARKRRELIGG